MHAVKDQSQSDKVNLLSEVAEGLFRMYMKKIGASQNELRRDIGEPKFNNTGPQEERKTLQRQVRSSLDHSARQTTRKNRPIFLRLSSNRSTYSRAFHALPLVIKCVPDPVKKKLVARMEAKAFKKAAKV